MPVLLPAKLGQLIQRAVALGDAQAVQVRRADDARKYASFKKRTLLLGALGVVAMVFLSAYQATLKTYLLFDKGYSWATAELASMAPVLLVVGLTFSYLLWCSALYIRFVHEKVLWDDADDFQYIEANRLRQGSAWAAEMYRAIQVTGRPLLMVDIQYLQAAATSETTENFSAQVIAARKAWATATVSQDEAIGILSNADWLSISPFAVTDPEKLAEVIRTLLPTA